MEKGLEYIFDKNTKVIILGTFPSIQSRNVCYYNNPQNIFWTIIAHIFNNQRPLIETTERYTCLLEHGIGLWDVIKACEFETKSSLDSKIKKETIVYNDFERLQQECPDLKCIVFNSRNAQKLFDRYIKTKAPATIKGWLHKMTGEGRNVLPSTSPANAGIGKEEKFAKWQAFLSRYI